MLGIDNLKKTLKFAADLADQIGQTKKFNFLSIFGFIDDLIALGGIVGSWADIVAEFKDLSDEERHELNTYAIEVLKVSPDKAKDFVADAIEWALLTGSLVDRRKDLKK